MGDINGSFNIGSPSISEYESLTMHGVTEAIVNHAVSSLRFPKECKDVSSVSCNSWSFQLPDVNESQILDVNEFQIPIVNEPKTPTVNGSHSPLESNHACHCSHLESKENNELSPTLSGPVDVT